MKIEVLHPVVMRLEITSPANFLLEITASEPVLIDMIVVVIRDPLWIAVLIVVWIVVSRKGQWALIGLYHMIALLVQSMMDLKEKRGPSSLRMIHPSHVMGVPVPHIKQKVNNHQPLSIRTCTSLHYSTPCTFLSLISC